MLPGLSKVFPIALILLEDIYVGDFDDFYTAQIYYEDRIPVKFRNKEKFIKLFEHNGFSTNIFLQFNAKNKIF